MSTWHAMRSKRLADTTQPAGTDFALGIEARCRALLADGDHADLLYREAIERLDRRRLRPDQARTHLLYGEWLRRDGRRVDDRKQLRTASEMFVTIGMDAFAERARRELMVTGEKVRKRRPETRDELTRQEEQIARLARRAFQPGDRSPSGSSAPRRSCGIWARCSPSSGSTSAASFERHFPRPNHADRPSRRLRRT